jgi:hypothetical protein
MRTGTARRVRPGTGQASAGRTAPDTLGAPAALWHESAMTSELAPDAIAERAVAVVRDHMEALTRGDLAAAREALFVAPGGDAAIDAYLQGMARLAPFEIRACEARRFQEFPRKMHGIASTVWVSVAVGCAAGERAAEIMVWWYPAEGRARMSNRPMAWLADAR